MPETALPLQLTYHVDPDNGRELIVNGWPGHVEISIYRQVADATTSYTVALPPDQVAQLIDALTAHYAEEMDHA